MAHSSVTGSRRINEIVAAKMPPWVISSPIGYKAGVVIYSIGPDGEIRFMLVSRKFGPRSFPKGTIESGDSSYEHAAIRELKEETGIGLEHEKLGKTPWVHFVDLSGAVRSVLFFVRVSVDTLAAKSDTHEVDKIEWFTFQQLHSMIECKLELNSGVRHVIQGLGIMCRYSDTTKRSRHAISRSPSSWKLELRTTLEKLSDAVEA